jgi:hypothetical protein
VVICRACQLAAALRREPRARAASSPEPAHEFHGAAVLAGRALPPGSADKVRALDQGLRAARGELVLFLDANNLPPPDSHAARSLDRTARRENP